MIDNTVDVLQRLAQGWLYIGSTLLLAMVVKTLTDEWRDEEDSSKAVVVAFAAIVAGLAYWVGG